MHRRSFFASLVALVASSPALPAPARHYLRKLGGVALGPADVVRMRGIRQSVELRGPGAFAFWPSIDQSKPAAEWRFPEGAITWHLVPAT